jgi:hypothetical protein
MALESLSLADVTWDELVSLARRRIAAVTRGDWTLHAPVDPGITMIELFAWLLEQRVFWLDQVPDSMVRALLALLGVTPRPEGVAGTVLSFASDGGWRVVPAGTAMQLAGAQPGAVFATDEAIAVAPIDSVRVIAGGRDRSADLAEGRWVQVLRADGRADELELRLQLASGPPAGLAARIAVLLELEAPAAMAPEHSVALAWPPAAVFPPDPERAAPPAIVLAPSPMRVPVGFLYRRAATGELAALPSLIDGTLGLRRAGVVRFAPPDDWAIEGDGTRAVIVRAERTGFTTPPRISAVHGNAVIARHWRRVVVALARRWLPMPGTSVDLPRALGAPLPRWARVYLRERAAPDRWQLWRSVDELSTWGPDARVVRVDRALARIVFGDGLTGRQPVLAEDAGPLAPPIDLGGALPSDPDPNVIVEYLVGGGRDGELGAGQAWTGVDDAWEASSPLAATGGFDAEGLGDARTRAVAELRAPHRAVTRRDYQELARTTPGAAIARAFAAVGRHPGHPCRLVPGATTVYVVPDAPRDEAPPVGSDRVDVRAPVPDADTLTLIQDRLDRARLAGHEVFVRAPRYRDAGLRFQVEADPRSPAALEARVRDALARYLDPLQGGDDRAGWPFGEPLRPSALIRAAQAAVGREGEVRAVAIALDGAVVIEVSCNDVAIGEVSLPRLGAVDVELVARSRTREVLR